MARSTVSNFLNGRPVSYLNFQEICRKLDLDWQEIADFGDGEGADKEDNLNRSTQRDRREPQGAVPDTDKLYKALLCLNYTKQESYFQDFIEKRQVGACLIHGDPEHGQRWLLNRLLRLIPHGTTTSFIRQFSLLRTARSSSINTLWRELGGAVSSAHLSSPSEIANAICQRWQTQTVVLIFHDVDQLPETYLNEFICEFWEPLAFIASNSLPQSRNYRLLVLLC